jgi:hypothetical protein
MLSTSTFLRFELNERQMNFDLVSAGSATRFIVVSSRGQPGTNSSRERKQKSAWNFFQCKKFGKGMPLRGRCITSSDSDHRVVALSSIIFLRERVNCVPSVSVSFCFLGRGLPGDVVRRSSRVMRASLKPPTRNAAAHNSKPSRD